MASGDPSTAILNALDDGLALWDRAHRFVHANPRYREILGPAAAALEPGDLWPGFVAALNDAGLFQTRLSADLIGEAAGAGLDLPCRDGRWIRLIDRPAHADGTIRIVRDITAEKARERDLQLWWYELEVQARDLDRFALGLIQAKHHAEAANTAKSSFLAGMSHELRTPMNAVLGFAEVIRDQVFGRQEIDRYSAYAADIHASGLHLLTLIDDILDLSKIEAGRMELREDVLDLELIIAGAFNLVHSAAGRGRVTVRRLARERVALRADGMKLKQCLLNVLSNAIKFTPPGGTVTLSVVIDAEYLKLRVQDTGIGIAPEDMARVFEPFRQVEGEMSRKEHGTGLGMPLTKRFVELHGGNVALESEVGRGTLVELRLPAARIMAQEGWDEDLTSREIQK